MVTSTANFTESDRLSGTELTAKEKGLELVRGICLPATCSVEKVIEYSNRKFEELKVTEAICRTNDSIQFDAVKIVTM
jgi:hypothetical protein